MYLKSSLFKNCPIKNCRQKKNKRMRHMTTYWCCQRAQWQYCRTGPTRNVTNARSIVFWTSLFSISAMLRHYIGVYWRVQLQTKHLKRIQKLHPVLKLRCFTFRVRDIKTRNRFRGWGKVLTTFPSAPAGNLVLAHLAEQSTQQAPLPLQEQPESAP